MSLTDSNPKISKIQSRQSVTCQISQVDGHSALQCPDLRPMPYPQSAQIRPYMQAMIIRHTHHVSSTAQNNRKVIRHS